MTVCIGALAADSKAIVCVADKALTYGERIQWDADSTKIIQLEPGAPVVLMSGGEEESSRVIRSLHSNVASPRSIEKLVSSCEESYKKCLQELLRIKFLDSRLLTRKEYVSGITGPHINPYMHELADSLVNTGRKFGCDLLICGFDPRAKPFILYLTAPGVVTDMTRTGFHAVGSGVDQAIPRLLWLESKRTYPIERVLYNVFDAKANSEISVGVGYEWDANILVPERGKTGVKEVPKEIKELIDTAWTKFTWSPFDEKSPQNRPDSLAKDWKSRLKDYADGLLASKVQTVSRTKRKLKSSFKKIGKRS